MSECPSVRGEWGGICPDCGERLPRLKPWGEGRPCSKTALDRGRGWNGGPLTIQTPGHVARWSTKPERQAVTA